MNPDEPIISRFRRDLTIGTTIKTALALAVIATFGAAPFVALPFDPAVVLLVVGAVWVALSMQSVRGQRLAGLGPSLIAAGDYDAADRQIRDSLARFSLFRTVKLVNLHHLAMLRHAQGRWAETAALCRALLRQRPRADSGLAKSSRLMLADASLAAGDLRGAYEALTVLANQELTLPEAMNRLMVQLEYEARIGAFDRMTAGLPHKVQLAEIMPASAAARVQALLALGAMRTGQTEWATWLRRRAELLVDVPVLVASRPVLRDVWSTDVAG